MTDEECRLIRQTFDSVREQAEPVSLLFYGRLFELDPSARRLFHNDLALQGRKLIDTLAAVVESLHHFESTRPRLARLGRQHAEYGVRPEQYEIVTAALLWAIGQALGSDFDRRARDAWTHALAAVCTAMKEGAVPG
jgi:hemoglobin-like flavoprotein